MGRLFWKFFFSILLAQWLATIAIGGAFWLKDQASDRRRVAIETGPPAIMMVNAAASTLQYGGVAALRDLIRNEQGPFRIYVVDDHGRELMERRVDGKLLEQARRLLPLQKNQSVVREVRSPEGVQYLLFMPEPENFNRRHFRGPVAGLGLIHGENRPPRPGENPLMPFIPLASAVIASLIIAALLAWYFSKPIRHLRRAFQAVAAGDLSASVGAVMGKRRDELVDLGKDFDSMVSQLNALMNGQRRLLHDVSHELRSPLARMQAAIGLARQQPARSELSLDRIEREGVRMDRLIDELLTLSRLEAGVAAGGTEKIHMDELLSEIVDDARFEAAAKGCQVTLSGHTNMIVHGHPEMLHRAIENVVRNAVKHTAPGSQVEIESRFDYLGQRLCLSILDQGPGVPQEALSNIFEPFFRAENVAKNAEGHGLGLAIAQRVIKAYGGSIAASNRPGGGLRMEIALPAEVGK